MLARQIHRKTGAPAEVLASLGSTVAFDALARGEIDAYVEYTGTIRSTLMHRTGAGGGRAAVLADVGDWLHETHGVSVACSLGFENTYAFALRRARPRARRAPPQRPGAQSRRLRAAADYEFWSRSEWADVRRRVRPGLRREARDGSVPALRGRGRQPGGRDHGLFLGRPHRRPTT